MSIFELRGLVGLELVAGPIYMRLGEGHLTLVSGQTGLRQTVAIEGITDANLSSSEIESVGPGDFTPSYGEMVGDHLWVWDHLTGTTYVFGDETRRLVSTSGEDLRITAIEATSTGAIVVGMHDQAALGLISNQDIGAVSSFVVDTAKTSIKDVSDILAVTVGSKEFIVATSYSEGGLTCLKNENDQLTIVDTIGSKDGIWTSGLTAIRSCEVNGEVYIIALSSETGSFVSLRLNEMGVFFKTDQIWDGLGSRFDGALDFEIIAWRGREFIVTGGRDLGLSLIEVLPDGRLFHLDSIEQSTEWNLGPITHVEAEVIGSRAEIFVSGLHSDQLAHLTIDLSSMGQRIEVADHGSPVKGGWTDDLLIGGAGNDLIYGKAGDDILFDGAGIDSLYGEDGADIFVFEADGRKDRIMDFVLGEDRIHLGYLGRTYDVSALEITQTGWGGTIAWGDELIEVFTKNGRPISVASWSEDDFIF